MKGRTCYVCNKCQIKVSNNDDGGKSGSTSSSNRSMMNTPLRPVKVFKSHCAPDKIDWNVPEKMTVKEIKKAIEIRALETEMLNFFSKGLLNGTVHTCVGQEIIGVIVAKYLEKTDFVVSFKVLFKSNDVTNVSSPCC